MRKDQFAVSCFSTSLIVLIQVYNWEIRHHSLFVAVDSPTFYIFLNVYILVQLFFSISANSALLEKLLIYSFQLLSFRIKLSDLF